VSAIGNFELVQPSAALNEQISLLMAWKLGLYGRDPVGRTRALDGSSRPVIGGHRDAGSTACPGQFLYDRLPGIRTRAAAVILQSQIGGDAAIPVAGDIDGNGAVNFGWFRDGRWAFAMGDGVVRRFGFGQAGDLPVMGDFDNDGRAEPGIFRSGEWHLRSDASSGVAWRTFRYGLRGDLPVVGRWPGGGSGLGVGVVRGNSWHLRYSLAGGQAQRSFLFGRAGDVPIVGDWLGDGLTRPGVVRAGTWYFATAIVNPVARWSYRFGWPDDSPLVVDHDDDGVQTATVVRGIEWFSRLDHGVSERVSKAIFGG
jgi:hypothetical protein